MIRRLDPTSAVSKALEQNDVLLSFDGVPVANDGTVPFRSGERIGFSYLVSQKYVGEQATLRVWRKGKELTIKIKLQVSRQRQTRCPYYPRSLASHSIPVLDAGACPPRPACVVPPRQASQLFHCGRPCLHRHHRPLPQERVWKGVITAASQGCVGKCDPCCPVTCDTLAHRNTTLTHQFGSWRR